MDAPCPPAAAPTCVAAAEASGEKNVSFTVLKAFSQIAGQAVLICKQGALKERLPCSVRANI